VNLRGEHQDTRLRDWLPGRCGLLPLLLFGAEDRLLVHRKVAGRHHAMAIRQLGFSKSGTRLGGRCRAEVLIALPPR